MINLCWNRDILLSIQKQRVESQIWICHILIVHHEKLKMTFLAKSKLLNENVSLADFIKKLRWNFNYESLLKRKTIHKNLPMLKGTFLKNAF